MSEKSGAQISKKAFIQSVVILFAYHDDRRFVDQSYSGRHLPPE